MANMSEFARSIRELRARAGLSQRDLAVKAGLAPAYIGHLESGARTNPSVKALEAIGRVLNAELVLRMESLTLMQAEQLPSTPADRLAVVVQFTSLVTHLPEQELANLVRLLNALESKYMPGPSEKSR